MAYVFLHPFAYVFAKLTSLELSGSVEVDGSPAARTILIYKNGMGDLYAETISDTSTGDWSVDVVATTNDWFRIICVGVDGENSQIFENVAAG